MPLNNRSVDELCRIAANGGGFQLDATGFITDDLCRIAANASYKVARLIIYNVDNFTTDDLCRIAANGTGAVSFQ